VIGRWIREILFVGGFLAFLWAMIPEENLPGPPRRIPPPDPPPVADAIPRLEPAPPAPVRQPPAPGAPPVLTRRLPPPSVNDPVIEIADKGARQGDSFGTAFVLDRGVWGTARHVIENCGRIHLNLGGRWNAASEARMHRNADVAVLRTERTGGAALPGPEPAQTLFLNQSGYHIGYPSGRAAGLRTRLIGRTLVRWPGSAKAEPTLSWVEVERVPEFDGPLGGISGGPVMDEQGRLVGITIASSVRRQRVTTSLVESLRQVAPALPRPGPGSRIDPAGFPEVAARLRGADTVTMAYCQADSSRPPPRRPRPAG